MIMVIFELVPLPEKRQEYLAFAAELASSLRAVDGFINVERFESLSEPGKLLSLSTWRDEAAVSAWRNQEGHRLAQAAGRERLFSGYRLRVAGVLRDYGMHDRGQAPADSQRYHAGR